jgi:histidine triad (HIT) family protein
MRQHDLERVIVASPVHHGGRFTLKQSRLFIRARPPLVTFEQRGVGHLLAIPIAHRPTLFDLTEPEAADLMTTIIRAAEAIRAAFDPRGIVVWQNNGVPANQSIPHVHFHVAGTLPQRRTNMGDVERLPTEATDRIASEIRPHLGTCPSTMP